RLWRNAEKSIIAMDEDGVNSGVGTLWRESGLDTKGSDFANLLLLFLQDLIHFLYILIGHFLNVRFRFSPIIFRQFGFFLQTSELLVRFATDRPKGNLRVFPVLVRQLDDVLAPFFTERGNGN